MTATDAAPAAMASGARASGAAEGGCVDAIVDDEARAGTVSAGARGVGERDRLAGACRFIAELNQTAAAGQEGVDHRERVESAPAAKVDINDLVQTRQH